MQDATSQTSTEGTLVRARDAELEPQTVSANEPFASQGGDPYTMTAPNVKRMIDYAKAAWKDSEQHRELFDRVWWRNLLYRMGRQWIVYQPGNGWVDKRLVKWVPRPVTNLIDQNAEAIEAVFLSVNNSAIASPMGENHQTTIAAGTANAYQLPLQIAHDFETAQAAAD